MARSRTVKPGFFTNEVLGQCNPLARLLLIGLWCLADGDGRLEDRPARIKTDTLPYDACDIGELLDVLHQQRFITRYTVGNTKAIQIANWEKHARTHPNEPCGELPEPPEVDSQLVASESQPIASKCALSCNSNLNSNPPTPQGGNDSEPETAKPKPTRTRKPQDAPAPGFDDFWEAYPRKDARERAIRAWNKIKPSPLLLAAMLAAITTQRQSRQWTRNDGEFIPQPATWLNGKLWENKGVVTTPTATSPQPDTRAETRRRQIEDDRAAAQAVPPPKGLFDRKDTDA